MIGHLHRFLYDIYSHICLAVLPLGSLIRFDREQYAWRSDTSQILYRDTLRMGSNLLHWGIPVIVVGHSAGSLAPHWMVSPFLPASRHRLLAMMGGDTAGIASIIDLIMLTHRRLSDTRVRRNGCTQDIVTVLMPQAQLALRLRTVVLSIRHMDSALFEMLTDYVKDVVTFHPGIAHLLDGVPLTYQLHILLGFTIFLVTPFTRIVHIWSGSISLAYPIQPYQLVCKC